MEHLRLPLLQLVYRRGGGMDEWEDGRWMYVTACLLLSNVWEGDVYVGLGFSTLLQRQAGKTDS